jgi:chemotaxis protein CheX
LDVSHINPFVRSAKDVFATMLGREIKRTGLRLKDATAPRYEVNGAIGISGCVSGNVVISLSPHVAFQVVKTFLGEEVSEVNPIVADAVAELTNMIAGNAKKELSESQLDLGLPTILNDGSEAAFPEGAQPICILFETGWGPMSLEIGLTSAAPAGVGL